MTSPVGTRRGTPLEVAVVSTPRSWAVLLTLVLVAGVVVALTPFAAGLLGALALYVVVERPFGWLARRVRPSVAGGITVLATLLFIIGPLAWLAIVLIDRASGATQAALASSLATRIGQLQIGDVRTGDALAKASGTIVGSLVSQLASFVGTTTAVTINLVVALAGVYSLLRAPSGTWESVRAYIPFSARAADGLRDRFIGATRATVLGTGVCAVTQGAIVGLGFAITGLPEPVFWGTVAIFAAVVPAIGSTLVWLPAVLFLVSERHYGGAVAMFIMGSVIAGNVDNIIRPLVYRRISEMHPMITLVGVLAGIRYLGLVGVLLGPLAIAYVFELLRCYRDEYSAAS